MEDYSREILDKVQSTYALDVTIRIQGTLEDSVRRGLFAYELEKMFLKNRADDVNVYQNTTIEIDEMNRGIIIESNVSQQMVIVMFYELKKFADVKGFTLTL